jgi:hypothetical protein
MVKDKINYRAQGPRTVLTRQTVQGRANDGGLRIGEMERDGIISHGAAKFLQESMLIRGDEYFMAVCNKTGMIAIYNDSYNLFLSPYADGPIRFSENLDDTMNIENISRFGRSFSILRVPYAFKLLIQELQTMNVQLRLITEENIDQLQSMSFSNNIAKLLGEEKTTIKDLNFQNYKLIRDAAGKPIPSAKDATPGKDEVDESASQSSVPYEWDEKYGLAQSTITPDSPLYQQSPTYPPQSPPYDPQSPQYVPQSPQYVPQSPQYVPQSPPYAPQSPPYAPQSPPYAQQSPPYAPQSPQYVPQSPQYVPQSPPVSPQDQTVVQEAIDSVVPAEQVADVVSVVNTAQNNDTDSPVINIATTIIPETKTNLEDITDIVGTTLDSKPTVSILTDIDIDKSEDDDDGNDQGGGKKVIINV